MNDTQRGAVRLLVVLVFIAVVSAFVVGCSSDPGVSKSGSETPKSTTTTTPGDAVGGLDYATTVCDHGNRIYESEAYFLAVVPHDPSCSQSSAADPLAPESSTTTSTFG